MSGRRILDETIRIATDARDAAASARGRANVAKGESFQQRIAHAIADALGLPLREVWTARSGRGGECDIQLSTKAHLLFPFWIEAKDRNKIDVPGWLRQAARDAAEAIMQLPLPGMGKAPIPVVVFRHEDRTYAIVPFFTFLDLATRHVHERTER